MKSLRGKYLAIFALVIALIATGILMVLVNWSLIRYSQEVRSGMPADEDRASLIDALLVLVTLLQVALGITYIVLFLVWFYRAYKNLHVAGVDGLAHKAGWAPGSFFVPIMNVVRPYRIMKEISSGSSFLLRGVKASSWKQVEPSRLIAWWWGLFLFTAALGRFASRLTLRAEELPQIITAARVEIISDIADIPAYLVTLLLVRSITLTQQAALTAGSLPLARANAQVGFGQTIRDTGGAEEVQ